MIKTLWTEKYRPSTLEGYVFKDDAQRRQVQHWIETKHLPHLLFSGRPGVGKTTLAKILINELKIEACDVLEINASRENSVNTVRDKIVNFCQTMPWGDMKIVLLDEADYISPEGQAALRGVMETYADSVRFILTCNYPNKVIPALHSRCQGFHIDTIDQVEFTARVANVLIEESVEFELDVLDSFVRSTYPDLRKCLNLLQMNSTNSKLIAPEKTNNTTSDYKLDMVELFKKGQIKEARKLIIGQAQPEEYEDIYRWLYENIDVWSKDEEKQDSALLIIRKALVNHSFIADPEINLSATLIELAREMQ
jgi:DNA polymerase III delta prime subunit